QILELCKDLKLELRDELQPGELGTFIKEWVNLEEYLLAHARKVTERNISVREAIRALSKRGDLTEEQALELDALRRFRNSVVHQPTSVPAGALSEWLERTRHLARALRAG